MTREEIIDGLEIYTVGRLNKAKVDITVEELQRFIDAIKALEQKPVYYPPCIDCNKKMDEIRNAYDNMTTRALEQESVIDKIRAEIEQLPTTKCTETCKTYIDVDDFKENVLEIIDKCNAESEDI